MIRVVNLLAWRGWHSQRLHAHERIQRRAKQRQGCCNEAAVVDASMRQGATEYRAQAVAKAIDHPEDSDEERARLLRREIGLQRLNARRDQPVRRTEQSMDGPKVPSRRGCGSAEDADDEQQEAKVRVID